MEEDTQEAQREEARRAAADIAINRMKNSGEMQRLETDRTVREEQKWGES
jgi:hypothetical protein